MEKNEIKKALYKQKPTARFFAANKDGMNYGATIDDDGLDYQVIFLVPFSDIGDALFLPEMESHLLIRYINNKN